MKEMPTPSRPAITPLMMDLPETEMMTDRPKKASAQYSGEPNSMQTLARAGAANTRTIQLKNVPMPEEKAAQPSAFAPFPCWAIG